MERIEASPKAWVQMNDYQCRREAGWNVRKGGSEPCLLEDFDQSAMKGVKALGWKIPMVLTGGGQVFKTNGQFARWKPIDTAY